MPKQRAQGADTQLLLGFEATYGTAPAAGSYHRLSFESIEFGAETPLNYQPLLGKGPEAQDPFYDAVDVSGRVTIPFDLREIGHWLRALYGAPVTSGDDPYDHVFTSGAALPSFTLEQGHTDLTTPRFLLATGVKAGGISFDMSRGGLMTATIDLIGQAETESGSTVDGSPQTSVPQLLFGNGGEMQAAGGVVGDVTGGRFAASNGLEPINTIRSDGAIGGVDETQRTCDGSAVVRYGVDNTLTDPARNETPIAMSYILTTKSNADHHLTFAVPRVFMPKKRQPISGPGGIEGTYEWRGARDETAGHLTQVTLRNDVANYT